MKVETTVGSCALRKRHRVWYARVQRQKKRYEINLGTEDASEAVARAQEMVPNLLLGRNALLTSGDGIPDDAYYRLMYRNARTRAQQRGVEFTLTDDEWKAIVKRAAGRCELTGIVLSLSKSKKGYRAPFAPSTDRINAAFGYTAGNVRIVCVAVNFALSDWGSAVFDAIHFAYLSKRLGQLAGELAGLKNIVS
jgi:hypothetical protein